MLEVITPEMFIFSGSFDSMLSIQVSLQFGFVCVDSDMSGKIPEVNIRSSYALEFSLSILCKSTLKSPTRYKCFAGQFSRMH